MTGTIDAARLTLMLNDLRLPAIKQGWPAFALRSDKEGWPAARFLAALAEHEVAERDRRRIERHLGEARLLPGKTLDNFDFDVVPMISKAHVMAICAGDAWIASGANIILVGGPDGGKSHLASAIGLGLIENGWRVLFARTSDLVQKLQVARRELALEAAITRLDRFGRSAANNTASWCPKASIREWTEAVILTCMACRQVRGVHAQMRHDLPRSMKWIGHEPPPVDGR